MGREELKELTTEERAALRTLARQRTAEQANAVATRRHALAVELVATQARAEAEKPMLKAKAEASAAKRDALQRECDEAAAVASRDYREAAWTATDSEVHRLRAALHELADPRIHEFVSNMWDLHSAIRREPAPRTAAERDVMVARLAAIRQSWEAADALVYQPVEDLDAALSDLRAGIPGELATTAVGA